MYVYIEVCKITAPFLAKAEASIVLTEANGRAVVCISLYGYHQVRS
jgi:hypothetical protein